MIKKYTVTVNGEKFLVEVEPAEEAAAVKAPQPAATTQSQPASASLTAPVTPAPTNTAPASAGDVVSPLPGVILKINCQVGSVVKEGDVVMILEAMKMENDIVAPKDGAVTAIHVQPGSTVQPGDILFAM